MEVHIHIKKELNMILLDLTLTPKVSGMPLIHLQSCLDQNVMTVIGIKLYGLKIQHFLNYFVGGNKRVQI